jgi:1-phosphatidylinositol-3-phosphate 5-kinase
MAVAKIKAYQPSVVLVEKSVSRHAQDLFLEKNISLVLNIKRPLLERVSRCTGAEIVPSIDYLSSQKLGHCDLFHVEKYVEEHGTAGEAGKKMLKTLMFFECCPKPFGCTVSDTLDVSVIVFFLSLSLHVSVRFTLITIGKPLETIERLPEKL